MHRDLSKQSRQDRQREDARTRQQRSDYDARYINDERLRGIYNRQDDQDRSYDHESTRRSREFHPTNMERDSDDRYEARFGNDRDSYRGEPWNQTERWIDADRTRVRRQPSRPVPDSEYGAPWVGHSYRNDDWYEDRAHQVRTSYASPYDKPQTYGPHAGRGPKGYRRSDDQICEEANQNLERNTHVDASDIEVSCKGGVLTLRGKVGDRPEKREAEECVHAIYGINDVMNELSVEKGFSGKPFSLDDEKTASKTSRKNS
jgi:hypothetical protein